MIVNHDAAAFVPIWPRRLLVATPSVRQMLHESFRIRGACAYEFSRRHHKQSGGRGRKDQAEQGATAMMQRLAFAFGVTMRTLYDDIRIYKEFFMKQTIAVDRNSLPREYLLAAVNTPNPQASGIQ